MDSGTLNIDNYIPLLHKIAGDFPYTHREELVNEGYLALYSTQKTFKVSKGVPFESYAYKRVKGAMKDHLAMIDSNLSLDETITQEDGMDITFADVIQDENDMDTIIENSDLYRHFMNTGNRIHRFIKERHYVEGMTPQMIADLYAEVTQIRDHRKIKEILTPNTND